MIGAAAPDKHTKRLDTTLRRNSFPPSRMTNCERKPKSLPPIRCRICFKENWGPGRARTLRRAYEIFIQKSTEKFEELGVCRRIATYTGAQMGPCLRALPMPFPLNSVDVSNRVFLVNIFFSLAPFKNSIFKSGLNADKDSNEEVIIS